MADPATACASRPALDIHLPAAPESLLPRLDALLDDYEPFAISDGGNGNVGETPKTGADARRASPRIERRVYFFSADARDAARRTIDRVLGPVGVQTNPNRRKR